jgi:hypothetical protein
VPALLRIHTPTYLGVSALRGGPVAAAPTHDDDRELRVSGAARQAQLTPPAVEGPAMRGRARLTAPAQPRDPAARPHRDCVGAVGRLDAMLC